VSNPIRRSRASIDSPRSLVALPVTSQQCEGEQHRLGTHGHDSGPARYRLRFTCTNGCSVDERLICAGRAADARATGSIKCGTCGQNYYSLANVMTLEPLDDVERPKPTLSVVATTADVTEAFARDQRARGFVETTVRGRLQTVVALEAFVGRSALELTTRDLLGYLGREGVKRSTRRSNQAALKAFYRFAVAERFFPDDPAAGLPAIQVPRGKPRPFSVDQISRMLESGAYRRTRAMILLGFHQGFRVSQIASVRGEDIDLPGRVIQTIGKGGKAASLPLHDVVAELSKSMPREGWWFPARDGRGGHIQPSSVSDLVGEAKARAGIVDPRLTAHSLRHAFGTELVEAGVDIRVIQELMMHEDLSTTQIYTGVSAGRRSAASDSLPAIGSPARSGRKLTGRESARGGA
jgi:integrase/recombinase XerD